MSKISELKAALKALTLEYANLKTLPPNERPLVGAKLNCRKQAILAELKTAEETLDAPDLQPIDLSAPAAPGQPLLKSGQGTKHPLLTELDLVVDIYNRMGFDVMESHQLDDEFHMFESLNFPDGHPARDGYDTFRTAEGFIPPAHTSTMQHRALLKYREQLLSSPDGHIAVVIPGRVFRNEDVDATHEHTFYQCEGIYVARDVNLGQMLGVLKHFFDTYYGENLAVRTQPGYFPFTEPSLEFMIKKPAALGGEGWLEMLGCGMIHPNVLSMANIDPTKFRGFAWGGGIDRLVMLKYGLNDVRYFESANLDFLTKF